MIPPWFPVEAVPDGTVAAPHHYTYPAMFAIIIALTVWDDYRNKEPLVIVGALTGGLIAFNLMWPHAHYRPLAPIIALLAPIIVILAVFNPWGPWTTPTKEGGYPWRVGLVIAFLALASLDDAIEHAFPWPTPLDTAFAVFGVYGSAVLGAVIAVGLILALTGWDRLRAKFGFLPTGEA